MGSLSILFVRQKKYCEENIHSITYQMGKYSPYTPEGPSKNNKICMYWRQIHTSTDGKQSRRYTKLNENVRKQRVTIKYAFKQNPWDYRHLIVTLFLFFCFCCTGKNNPHNFTTNTEAVAAMVIPKHNSEWKATLWVVFFFLSFPAYLLTSFS